MILSQSLSTAVLYCSIQLLTDVKSLSILILGRVTTHEIPKRSDTIRVLTIISDGMNILLRLYNLD